jgi:FMN reductase
MSYVVTIEGSPCGSPRSAALLDYTNHLVRRCGAQAKAIPVRNLPAEDLLHARIGSEAIQNARALIDRGEGVIVMTPIRKSSYTGVLKAFLDLLPQDALAGKTVLPVATGGSCGHLLALDYALKPVLAALGACSVLRGVYITDSQIQFAHGGAVILDEDVDLRLKGALDELVAAIRTPAGPELVEDGYGI